MEGGVGLAVVSSLVGLDGWMGTVKGESGKVDWAHAFEKGLKISCTDLWRPWGPRLCVL